MAGRLNLNFRSLFGLASKPAFPNVLPTEHFRKVIARERSRSDRNSHGFSLVVFDADTNNGKRKSVIELGNILESRIRLTDVLGWVGAGGLGTLLPDTHPDGARKFTDHVRCAMLERCGRVQESKVYGYPDNLKPDDYLPNGDDRQMWFEGFEVGTVDRSNPIFVPCRAVGWERVHDGAKVDRGRGAAGYGRV